MYLTNTHHLPRGKQKQFLLFILDLRILHIQTVAWCTNNLHYMESSTIQTLVNKQQSLHKRVNKRKTVCQCSQPTSTHRSLLLWSLCPEEKSYVNLAYIHISIHTHTIHTRYSIHPQTNTKTSRMYSLYRVCKGQGCTMCLSKRARSIGDRSKS